LTFVELTGIEDRPTKGPVGSTDIRERNEQVRRLADKLPGSTETKFLFDCQCGCGTVVPLTSTNFDANGAWADGHKPDTGSGLEAGAVVP
jgi:hypothetical protein